MANDDLFSDMGKETDFDKWIKQVQARNRQKAWRDNHADKIKANNERYKGRASGQRINAKSRSEEYFVAIDAEGMNK